MYSAEEVQPWMYSAEEVRQREGAKFAPEEQLSQKEAQTDSSARPLHSLN
jgi:hypothetical protein